MFTKLNASFCWILLAGLAAGSGNSHPAINISFPNYQYQETATSIRDVDFGNLKYHLLGEEVKLRKGRFKKARQIRGTDAIERVEVSLGRVWYFDLRDGQPQRALVSVVFFSAVGSSSNTGILLVFALRDEHPTVTQQLDYDLQAPGTGESFERRLEILTVKARSDDGSAHCCPQHLDVASFKWEQDRFGLKSYKTLALLHPNP